jgi:hypothetical protein
MNFRLPALVALACSAAFAFPAAGQAIKIKPGLWEISQHMSAADPNIQSTMAELQKQMAGMDPEQRKMMEQMMAQNGIHLDTVGAGTVVVKMCMTPEMAKRNSLPLKQEGNCNQSWSKPVGGRMTFTFSCTDPRSTGEGEVTFTDDSNYRMNAKASGFGGPMTIQASARRLGSECGDLKPPAMPQAQ